MIWRACVLVGARQEGEDELGNPKFEEIQLKTTLARISPWTNEEIQIEGREVIKNEQKILLRLPHSIYCGCGCTKIRFDKKEYEVLKDVDLFPRYTLLRVKSYRR